MNIEGSMKRDIARYWDGLGALSHIRTGDKRRAKYLANHCWRCLVWDYYYKPHPIVPDMRGPDVSNYIILCPTCARIAPRHFVKIWDWLRSASTQRTAVYDYFDHAIENQKNQKYQTYQDASTKAGSHDAGTEAATGKVARYNEPRKREAPRQWPLARA